MIARIKNIILIRIVTLSKHRQSRLTFSMDMVEMIINSLAT